LEQEITSKISDNSEFLNNNEIKIILQECLELINSIKFKKQEFDLSLSKAKYNLLLSTQQSVQST